jgi:hypothetical protein
MNRFCSDGVEKMEPPPSFLYQRRRVSVLLQFKRRQLFSFSISEVFRKIGQPHEDDAQSGHIDDVEFGKKHAGQDHGKTGPQDGPDDEDVKLGQDVTSFQVGWFNCLLMLGQGILEAK